MDARTQSPKICSPAVKLTLSQLETALKAVAKLLVSIRFYPAGHPALKDVTSDAKASFEPLLQRAESLVVVVRRTGFYYEDEPVGASNAMLQKLAAGLFARRIQQLMFLKDLSCRDLWETAQIFLLEVDMIQKGGGVKDLLQRARVTTIWTNVIDIKGIFELKNQIEMENEALYGSPVLADEEFLATLGEVAVADGENGGDALTVAAEAPLGGELTFVELLKSVEMAVGDQEFSGLLQRLIPVVRGNLTAQSAHLVLQSLSLLAQAGEGRHSGEFKRKTAQQAIEKLTSPQLLGFYIELLRARVRFDEHSIAWEKINQSFGVSLTKLLLTRLFDEEDQAMRKVLAESLISQGSIALPTIVAALQDDRWTVMRNAIYLLGEIRDGTAIEPLRFLLRHRDVRVRREALRALTRIGGNSVIGIIANILQGNDIELRRQAILCLGVIRNSSTIPLLVQLLQRKDWRFVQLEEKIDAIRSLAEIGSVDAIPALRTIVNNQCLFYRGRNNELRAAALLAMGEIGGTEAIHVLEILENNSNPLIAKAAMSALKQARKGYRHD